MTDNEIIKALECCVLKKGCGECPANPHIRNYGFCTASLIKGAYDLINRQNAEIERLNGCVKSEDEVRKIMKSQMTSVIREITNEQIDFAVNLSKAEAIKDFAEIIISDYPEMEYYLNNIVEEMIGEQE